jgi:hypothetical protein
MSVNSLLKKNDLQIYAGASLFGDQSFKYTLVADSDGLIARRSNVFGFSVGRTAVQTIAAGAGIIISTMTLTPALGQFINNASIVVASGVVTSAVTGSGVVYAKIDFDATVGDVLTFIFGPSVDPNAALAKVNVTVPAGGIGSVILSSPITLAVATYGFYLGANAHQVIIQATSTFSAQSTA